MIHPQRFLRIVGAFYLLQFVVMVFVRAPIRAQGPESALALEAAGDEMARFLVDTWVTFGLEVGGIGAAVLLVSRSAAAARFVIPIIVAIELARGIAADLYMLARGGPVPVLVVWLVIHSIVIVFGLLALRSLPPEGERAAVSV